MDETKHTLTLTEEQVRTILLSLCFDYACSKRVGGALPAFVDEQHRIADAYRSVITQVPIEVAGKKTPATTN